LPCGVFAVSADARKLGYDTYVVLDASRGISEESVRASLEEMKETGIKIVKSFEIESL